jgi:hypothetical protein
MSNQTINIGTIANDGTGDTLRAAMDKVNDNFIEVYANTAALRNSGSRTFAIDSLGSMAFDGTTNDATAFQAIIDALPSGSNTTIIMPPKQLYTGSTIYIPNDRTIHFICEPGFQWIRKDTIVLLEANTGLSVSTPVNVSAITVTSQPVRSGAGNALTTRFTIDSVNNSRFTGSEGKFWKIVADDVITGQTLDADATKRTRIGQMVVIAELDSPNNFVFVNGELEARHSYTTRVRLLEFAEHTFSWTGGVFSSTGSGLGVADRSYIVVKSRIRPRVTGMRTLNGYGKGVDFIGCIAYIAEDCHFKDLANDGTAYGYGINDAASWMGYCRNISGEGDMRHVVDCNAAKHVANTSSYWDWHGRSRGTIINGIRGYGMGHACLAPHSEAVDISVSDVQDHAGFPGNAAQGAIVSARSPRISYSRVTGADKPVGFEVNTAAAGAAVDITLQDFNFYRVHGAQFATSLIDDGDTIQRVRVYNGRCDSQRGMFGYFHTGSYEFTDVIYRMTSNLNLGTFNMITPSNNNVTLKFTNCTWDTSDHAGTGTITFFKETAARVGQRVIFQNCKFIANSANPWSVLLDCGTPVGTGTNRNRYEFINCDFGSGTFTTMISNQGTADVIIEGKNPLNGGRIASGKILLPVNHGGTTKSTLSTGNLYHFLPFYFNSRQQFSAIGVWLETAQTGAACRLDVRYADADGKPGGLIQDFGELSWATGTNTAVQNTTIAWTPPREGLYFVGIQNKAASPQANVGRMSTAWSNFGVNPTLAEWGTLLLAIGRMWKATDSYGAAPAFPTGLTVPADTSQCPVVFFVAS